MKKLLQIIYISRSTFESSDGANIIEPNVARILAKSRINNRKNGLVGVLYFGNSVFFQCLEGEEEAVNALLVKLEADNRHKDLKVISKNYINQLSFGGWAMKFAPLDKEITNFLKENNFQKFDPYLFSGEVTNQFLSLLFNAYDVSSELKPPTSLNKDLNPEQQQKNATNRGDIKSTLALIISILALAVSLIAIYLVK